MKREDRDRKNKKTDKKRMHLMMIKCIFVRATFIHIA